MITSEAPQQTIDNSFPTPSSSFLSPPHLENMPSDLEDRELTPTWNHYTTAPPPQDQDAVATSPKLNGKERPVSSIQSSLSPNTSPTASKHLSTPILPSPFPQTPLHASSSRISLSSTRPAPSSPAPSRHNSLRRKHSTSSRRQSTLSVASSKSKRRSSPSLKKRRSLRIKIRDFAFPKGDERHSKIMRLSPTSSFNPNAKRDSSPHSNSRGWSGFFTAAKFSFGPFGGGGGSNNARDSRSSNSRNYDDPSPSEDYSDEYDDDDDDEGAIIEPPSPTPLLPGIYRALYPFVPEGAAEMALEEDQIVNVLGRGGGPGWVVVESGTEGGQALVPEGYLELVNADSDA